MKVTVCFGNVRVVVPCGTDGALTVGTLIAEAVCRYKKATNKASSHTVNVHCLRSQAGRAVLNKDDFVCDVAADKEQIIAEFDESEENVVPCIINNNNNVTDKAVDVILTGVMPSTDDLFSITSLTKDYTDVSDQCLILDNNSSQVKHDENKPVMNGDDDNVTKSDSPSPVVQEAGCSSRSSSPDRSNFASPFARSSARKSLGNGLSVQKWFFAQEKVMGQYENQPSPAGYNASTSDSSNGVPITQPVSPLPCLSSSAPGTGAACWLNISKADAAEQSSTMPRRLPHASRHQRRSSDVSLNATEHDDMSKNCCKQTAVKADVNTVASASSNDDETERSVKASAGLGLKTFASPAATSPSTTGVLAPTNTRRIGSKFCIDLVKGSDGLGFSVTSRDNLQDGNRPIYIKNILPRGAAVEDGRLKAGDRLLEVNGVQMTGKSQSEAVAVLRAVAANAVVALIVSRQIVDDAEVLALSDVPTGGTSTTIGTCDAAPSTAAAVEASLVKVESSENKSVCSSSSPVVSTSESSGDRDSAGIQDDRERLTFHVALGESGFASLGISVTKVFRNRRDCGIFIKSVRIGGMAAKDGRLRVNDQLVDVNGVSLTGMDNARAIQVLREAMLTDGRARGFIGITVLRPRAARNAAQSTSPVREVRVSQAGNDDVADGIVAMLPRRDPVERSTTAGVSSKHVLSVADSLPVTLASDVAQQQASMSSSPVDIASDSSSLLQDLRNADEDDFVGGEMSPDDVNITPAFQREGFGRQSMSEKRKGHIDPKSLDLYQKLKQGKDKTHFTYATWDPRKSPLHKSSDVPFSSIIKSKLAKTMSTDCIASQQLIYRPLSSYDMLNSLELSSASSLKKHKSLEDLQTNGIQEEDEDASSPPVACKKKLCGKTSRGCGVNESFRAAIDRSYDPDSTSTTDAVNEDQIETESQLNNQFIISTPKSSKEDGRRNDRGWGFFRGLMDLFRASKTKKSEEVTSEHSREVEGQCQSPSRPHTNGVPVREISKTTRFYVPPVSAGSELAQPAKTATDAGHYLTSSQSQKLYIPEVFSSRGTEYRSNDRRCTSAHGTGPRRRHNKTAPSDVAVDDPVMSAVRSKFERIQQLRHQYQQAHRERHGRYLHDDNEDLQEQQLKHCEQQRQDAQHAPVHQPRLLSRSDVETSDNFQHCLYSRQTSGVHDAVDFSTSSLPRRVGSADQSHRLSYYDSSLPMLMGRNAKLSNGRLGTVSPYDVGHSPSPGWSQRCDNTSVPENHARPPRTAVNLPMRRHLAHVPLNAVADHFPSNDHFRYSYREHAMSPPSTFQRIVSLPTRHQRRHHATVPARSAQV